MIKKKLAVSTVMMLILVAVKTAIIVILLTALIAVVIFVTVTAVIVSITVTNSCCSKNGLSFREFNFLLIFTAFFFMVTVYCFKTSE